jgi:hypothetical protein
MYTIFLGVISYQLHFNYYAWIVNEISCDSPQISRQKKLTEHHQRDIGSLHTHAAGNTLHHQDAAPTGTQRAGATGATKGPLLSISTAKAFNTCINISSQLFS